MYVTPCHFLLYSSNIIVTLTEETNRSSHSDTKKLDHFITCNIIRGFTIHVTEGRLLYLLSYFQVTFTIKFNCYNTIALITNFIRENRGEKSV